MSKAAWLGGLLLLVPGVALASNASPVGKWQTYDPQTGKPKTIIEITETPEGELTGTIIQRFAPANDPDKGLCVKCQGPLKNRPLVGMKILWGVRRQGDAFTNGRILAPSMGRVLGAKIRLLDDGQKLDVRVHLGPIGRTGTWTRVAEAPSDPVR